MSLKINTNIPAMTAIRHLSETEAMMQGSITRLSTGLRINSAGDDPAGLIISEGLRSQIRGLNQAMKNSQDAVNMSKTAEGALDEVSRLLLSLRSITVQSANTAVMDASQLQANQAQIRAAIQSINRIAEQTSWGTKKLLNGASGATAGITQTNLVSSLNIGSEFNGETVRSGNITMTRVTAATQTTTGALATTFAASTTAVNPGTFVINGVTFTSTAGETVGTLLAKINAQSNITNVTATHQAGGGITLTSTKFGSNFPINYLETTNILNGGAASNPAVGADAVFNVTVPVEPSPNTQTEVFTGGQGPGIDGLTLSSPGGHRMVISAAGNSTAGATVIGALSVGTLRFQIGANADQAASFSIPSIFADRLGTTAIPGQSMATVDVTTQQGATDAMKIVDDAINQIAFLRGELGSFQKNFLESTIRSLSIAEENMTASESAIRDADIAKEMTEYTKVQILRESGMSVLAQANKAPQSVLQLLRG